MAAREEAGAEKGKEKGFLLLLLVLLGVKMHEKSGWEEEKRRSGR